MEKTLYKLFLMCVYTLNMCKYQMVEVSVQTAWVVVSSSKSTKSHFYRNCLLSMGGTKIPMMSQIRVSNEIGILVQCATDLPQLCYLSCCLLKRRTFWKKKRSDEEAWKNYRVFWNGSAPTVSRLRQSLVQAQADTPADAPK